MANGRKLASQAPSTRAANPLHALCMPTPTTTAASVRPAGERDRHQIGEEAQATQAASAAHPTQQRKSPQSFSSRANAQKTAMHKSEQASQTSLAKQIVGGTMPGQRGASALRQGLASTTPATSTAYPAPPTASAPGKHPGMVTSATQQVAGKGISRLVKGRREERRKQRAASAAARPARLAAAVGGAAGGDGSAPLPRSAFKRGETVETIVAL
jgi:hypothetical protein